jgi:hypothetical protein
MTVSLADRAGGDLESERWGGPGRRGAAPSASVRWPTGAGRHRVRTPALVVRALAVRAVVADVIEMVCVARPEHGGDWDG